MMQLLNKKRKLIGNKGFSLVELIIVIAIMAVLVAILAPQFLKYVENSRVASDNTSASELLNAVKVAITNESIYDDLDAAAVTTIVWNGSDDSITLSNNAPADLDDEIQTTLGLTALSMEAKAKVHKDQNYTITINAAGDVPVVSVPDTNNGWADNT